jgi:uncharacterized OsmC-like protein
MATAEVIYKGDLRTTSRHLLSGSEIITDAPLDNHGKGSSFSPTDLLATSLANCMLTVIGIAAETHQFSIDGTRSEVTKFMTSNPRKVSGIEVKLFFPQNNFSEKVKKIIEHTANTCPVALSLHPELAQTIIFNY